VKIFSSSSDLFCQPNQHFSRLTRPIFFILTCIGLKPHIVPKESNNNDDENSIKNVSGIRKFAQNLDVIGVLFWLPLPFLGINATRLNFQIALYFIKKYGFFHPASVNAMQTYLLVQMGLIFALSVFLYAPKFVVMIRHLDSISLSVKAQKDYQRMEIVASVLLTFLSFSFIAINMVTMFKGTRMLAEPPNWFSIINFLSTFQFSLISFLGLLSWGVIVPYFTSLGFKANRQSFAHAMTHKDDSEKLRQVYWDYLRLADITDDADTAFAPFVLVSVSSYAILISTLILNLTAYADNTSMTVAYTIMLVFALLGICYFSILINEEVSFCAKMLDNEILKCLCLSK
jgi:hypothetical protein